MERIFGDLYRYGKHESSYFNIPAGLMVLIAYLLPGLLNMIYSGFSYFATLVLIAVAAFERKSTMVRLYCLQFCFYSMFFNIIITALCLVSKVITLITPIVTLLSMVVSILTIVVLLYSIYQALNYNYWKMPLISEFITSKFIK